MGVVNGCGQGVPKAYSLHLCKWEDISPLLRLTDTDVSDIIKGKFLSLRGKGSTLGAWKFSSGNFLSSWGQSSRYYFLCCSQDLTPLRATIL